MSKTLNPPFFRRSYIIGGYFWRNNVRIEVVVHGLYFCFWHEKKEIDSFLEDKCYDIWHDETFKGGNPTVTKEGWELEQVKSDESIGLGFYRARILVNDKPVETVDFRHRSERF